MLTFDPAMDAPATLKERVIWLLFMGIVFFLLYGAANEFASLTAPHLSFFFDWEKRIDFIPAFIVPYMSSDLVFVVAFLLAQTRFELRVLALRVLFIVLFSVLIFVLFPLQFSFEKPPVTSFTFLFRLLEADHPFNQLPSLHVSFAIVLWFSMKNHLPNRMIKSALFIWLLLIIGSTLFVFQHHFIDIPTGFVVGIFAVYFIRKGHNERLLNQFMTPRHLKMGLYFLLLSIVLMLLSFAISPVFIYFFICTFSVSLIYAFGFKHLLVGSDGKVNLLRMVIFVPYFLGCKISWILYKRKIPLLTKVDEGVYLGRHPSVNEYEQISQLGVKQVINLAVELSLNKTALTQHKFNFLDQTIQSPESLHQAVLLIEQTKAKGIYVHCALGLSRSVLVIWAWMLYNEKSNEVIVSMLEKLNPHYLQSKYMSINMVLYQDYLQSLNHRN
jgi:hypothetical protein